MYHVCIALANPFHIIEEAWLMELWMTNTGARMVWGGQTSLDRLYLFQSCGNSHDIVIFVKSFFLFLSLLRIMALNICN